ncbi:MAG TPA: tRNA pseudouridine(55) synthase TruB [Malonomonas sp.]
MHGILLIDKPAGLTSHDVVRQVRRICRTKKVGHAGTLDPLATGVLPVAVGDGTKILQFLLAEDKSYRATLRFGITTDTLDAEGQVQQQRPVPVDVLDRLEPACELFRGYIEQIPPMYSALKKDGVPLYKLARNGQTVEREARQVRVDRLEIISQQLPDLTIEVDCSKGTYIRTLAADIGEELGCGAHLTALRRLRCGRFSIADCVTLDELSQRTADGIELIGLDQALCDYPAVQALGNAAVALTCGVPPAETQVSTEKELVAGELVRLQIDGILAAVARYAPLRTEEKRGDFELVRVFVAQ